MQSMSERENNVSKREVLILAGLALLAMVCITVASVPRIRNGVKNYFSSSQRQVLSKIQARVSGTGPILTVLKIKQGENLFLEVYKRDTEGNLVPLSKLLLNESRDGHFILNGNATNLALTDVDQNGDLEIVAPTYDEQLIPRLNIFKFNPESETFDRVNAPDNWEP